MHIKELQNKISVPSLLGEKDSFLIKLVETEEEMEKAFRLRYKIFNLEQGKGLETAIKNGIDRDEFDDYCMHLVIQDKKTGDFVGTYRIHLGPVAKLNLGFYSSREYDICGLDKIADQAIEVGRSCVAPEFRNGAVVALLWRGITEVLRRSRLKYLFGCVSLETTDPAMGWALYRYFEESGKLCDTLSAKPVKRFELEQPSEDRIQACFKDRRALLNNIPPLFKGYLRLGTKICSKPALDDEFGTIDYLILLDTGQLPERYFRHFVHAQEEATKREGR